MTKTIMIRIRYADYLRMRKQFRPYPEETAGAYFHRLAVALAMIKLTEFK